VHASTLWAQNSNSVDFRVIQLAAQQVYFEAGGTINESELPAVGDTLYIFRESLYLGAMTSLAVSPPRVAATFQDDLFLVTRGEYLTIKWNIKQLAVEVDNQQDEDEQEDTSTASILNRPTSSVRSGTPKKKTEISGRLMTITNLTESSTRWSRVLDKSDIRWSSVPSANITLRVQQLPGDWDLNLNGRYSYRMQTDSRINNTSIMNIYNLNAVKSWEKIPLKVQLGRFYNRYDTNYSFWDGALIHLNTADLGGGISAGWEPKRSNEGIQTDFPKLGGFFNYQIRNEELRYRGNMSLTSVFPSGYSTQFNAGLEQRFDYKWFSLDGIFSVDRAPYSGTFKLTRLRIRTGVEITRWLSIRTHFRRRRPYSYQFGDGTFFSSREQLGVNTTLKFGNWWVNSGVSINSQVNRNSTSYDTRIQWYRSPIWALSWTVHGSYWNSDRGSSWSGGLSAAKSMKSVRASAGATLYNVSLLGSNQLTVGFFFNGTKTINRRLSVSLRLQNSISELMHRNSLSLSLWKTF